MTERKGQFDPNETPDDVASLYSWANLHGAKYRDFSSSRAQTRERARQRVEQAMEDERLRAHQNTGAQGAEDEMRRAEFAAQQAAEQAAQQAAWPQPRFDSSPTSPPIPSQRPHSEYPAHEDLVSALRGLALPPSYRPAANLPPPPIMREEREEREERQQREVPEVPDVPEVREQREVREEIDAPRYSPPPSEPRHPTAASDLRYAAAPSEPRYSSSASDLRYAAAPSEPRYSSAPPEPRYTAAPSEPRYSSAASEPLYSSSASEPTESASRPAWLTPEPGGPSTQPGLPQAPEDTLQGSRERLATRWYALRGVFESSLPPAQAVPAPIAARAPVMAVFSLAGGVGKTSLVATLGRALSARGERVLLVDTAAYGLLPFFFGACDQRPGMLRTFTPPASSGDAPIQMITLDPEAFGPESAPQEALTAEISKHARGVGRVIVDLATASGATTRRIMRMSPQVLVPLMPDMNSVVSVSSIDAFFDRNGGTPGAPKLPHYVLNQFDSSLPLHLDVREVLREQLGERLLPFVLRRTPAVSEALAEGMTVMDYAPNSVVAEDFSSLAGWVKSLSAPATTSFRGVRWSER